MINRENLSYIKNILRLNNDVVNLNSMYDLLTAAKDENFDEILEILFLSLEDNVVLESSLKKKIISILNSLRHNNYVTFYNETFSLVNKELDTSLLSNVLTAIKHNPDYKDDILDSFSNNQYIAKTALIKSLEDLKILSNKTNVVIWGCWYGSLLFPLLSKKVNKIIGIDLNEDVIKISKNKLFKDFENVDFVIDDVFNTYRNFYLNTNLIINTSCEHMNPMKEWPWFDEGAIEEDAIKTKWKNSKLSSNCYFAFQSNNMHGIEGHINCVNSIDEFKSQLPNRAEVIHQDEVIDSRGTRYMLIGKFNPL